MFSIRAGQLADLLEPLEIYAENVIGRTVGHTRLQPINRLSPPTNLKKVKSTFNSTIAYTICWRAPKGTSEIVTSYTVFWCDAAAFGTEKCDENVNNIRSTRMRITRIIYFGSFQSDFNFTRLNSSTTYFSMNSTRTLNFAVSANSIEFSSGMVWSSIMLDGNIHNIQVYLTGT